MRDFLGNNLKYEKKHTTRMPSGGVAGNQLFLDPNALEIMYLLIEKNPAMPLKNISKETGLGEEKVFGLLMKLASEHIVYYDDEEETATLTKKGIAKLYNYHKAFVEPEVA